MAMAPRPHKIYHARSLDNCGWVGQYHFSFGTSVELVYYGQSLVLCGPRICHFGLLLFFENASTSLATSVGLGVGGKRGLGHYVSGLCLIAFDLAFSICRRSYSLSGQWKDMPLKTLQAIIHKLLLGKWIVQDRICFKSLYQSLL
jgi:hypothetical protein